MKGYQSFTSCLVEEQYSSIINKIQKEVEKRIGLKQKYVLVDFNEIFDFSSID